MINFSPDSEQYSGRERLLYALEVISDKNTIEQIIVAFEAIFPLGQPYCSIISLLHLPLEAEQPKIDYLKYLYYTCGLRNILNTHHINEQLQTEIINRIVGYEIVR